MSEPEDKSGDVTTQGRGGTVWDAPNQQVVPDGQPPWVEGTGGTPGPGPQELAERQAEQAKQDEAEQAELLAARSEAPPAESAQEQPKSLDEMTKAELLEHAKANGIAANNDMTKDEIRAAIHQAG